MITHGNLLANLEPVYREILSTGSMRFRFHRWVSFT